MPFDEPNSSLGSKSLSGTSQSPPSHAPQVDNAMQSLFFRLPYELRRMIFIRHIALCRAPDPSDIHLSNLSLQWRDIPSPLLGTCRQIRSEVKDLLRHNHIPTLRVTTFGVAFDMLSLSCFIAQGLPKSYIGLPGLRIEIWPPHHDEERRDLEMLYLHEHLRKLRDKLRAGPHIPQLSIRFRESWIVKWSEEGQPRQTLRDYDRCTRNDMQIVLDLFACVTNVDKMKILLPPTIRGHQILRDYACLVIGRMKRGFLEYDLDIYNEKDKSILDKPFIFDTKHLEKIFLKLIRMDEDDLFAIDFQLLYLAWHSNTNHSHKKCRLLSDFENINLSRHLRLFLATIDASERIEAIGYWLCFYQIK